MDLKYDGLIGRQFQHGKTDCYDLIRTFYEMNFGLKLRNYARPDDWWDLGFDLYREAFHDEGFRVLNCHPSEYQIGDVFLMAVRSTTANHAGVLVENNKILHHLWGRRSLIEPYRGLTRNTTLMVLRHKDIVIEKNHEKIDVMEYLPDAVRQKIAAALLRGGSGESGADTEHS